MTRNFAYALCRRHGFAVRRGKINTGQAQPGTSLAALNGTSAIEAAKVIARSATTEPKTFRRSADNRTQVWVVACPVCEFRFSPPTTMLATQEFMCPRKSCQSVLHASYNAEPPVVKVLALVK